MGRDSKSRALVVGSAARMRLSAVLAVVVALSGCGRTAAPVAAPRTVTVTVAAKPSAIRQKPNRACLRCGAPLPGTSVGQAIAREAAGGKHQPSAAEIGRRAAELRRGPATPAERDARIRGAEIVASQQRDAVERARRFVEAEEAEGVRAEEEARAREREECKSRPASGACG